MISKALIVCVIAVILIVSASRALAQQSCYRHDVAYLQWLTVVRKKPGLYGRAISASWSQDGFPVTNSLPVRGDCWAKTYEGWLPAANLAAEPFPTPSPRTLTHVRLPLIKGDAEFVKQITIGLAFLRDKAPRWYQYVTQPEYSIEPTRSRDEKSRAQWPERRVNIHADTFVSPMRLARVLVHEACHIHQGEAARWPKIEDGCYARVHVEQECVSRELEMVVDIDLEHSHVVKRGYTLAKPYEWWASEYVSSPTCPAESV